MIKKILIGIVTAGMILTTIPTVNAEDEITLNEVTDQIIDISDKYNSAGITSGQLLNLITLTQTDDELLDTISLDKNNLFDTSIPKKVNIQSSRSGDLYDGNPPASKGEQKDRMKYIDLYMIMNITMEIMMKAYIFCICIPLIILKI